MPDFKYRRGPGVYLSTEPAAGRAVQLLLVTRVVAHEGLLSILLVGRGRRLTFTKQGVPGIPTLLWHRGQSGGWLVFLPSNDLYPSRKVVCRRGRRPKQSQSTLPPLFPWLVHMSRGMTEYLVVPLAGVGWILWFVHRLLPFPAPNRSRDVGRIGHCGYVCCGHFSTNSYAPLLPFRAWSGVASGRPPSPSGRAGKLVADVLQ